MSLHRMVSVAVILMLAASCGGPEQGASSSTRRSSSTIAPTSTMVPTGVVPNLAMHGPHEAATFAPADGWIVTETPFEFGVWFPGRVTPEAVEINGVIFEADVAADWSVSQPVNLEPGVNAIDVVVRYQGTVTHDLSVPLTYLPDAEVRLGTIVSVETDSITVDYAQWVDDGEFPGPDDPDPGAVEVLSVDDHVDVIVHQTFPVDYAWLGDQFFRGTPREDPYWTPQNPYWITISDGAVVELWMIPLG